MNDQQTTIQQLAASRLRKCLYWARMRREPVADQVIEQIIRTGIWRLWGYARLGDLLMKELGLQVERAADWTGRAIKWGCEDARAYGC